MSLASRPGLRDVAVLIAGLVATAATVSLLSVLPHASPTTAALALLLVVLATSTFGRWWIATVVAIAGTLSLNFFFLPPVGTFRIADPQQWIALSAFLVAALIASNLSAAAQARAREAIARRNEVTRLFDLTRDVLLTTETVGAIDTLARHVAGRFQLSRVAICLPGEGGWHIHQGGSEELRLADEALNTALINARSTLEGGARQLTEGDRARVGDIDAVIVPLRHGTKAIGLLAAGTPALGIDTLDAVAAWSRLRSSGRSFWANVKRPSSCGRRRSLPAFCSPPSATI